MTTLGNILAGTEVSVPLGLNEGGVVRRGKAIIATEEGRTNVAYGLLATPDRVQNVVVPAGGILRVRYRAWWKESVAGAARAAIFLGANQLKADPSGEGGDVPTATEAVGHTQVTTNTYGTISSFPSGLIAGSIGAGDPPTDPTTGLVLGFSLVVENTLGVKATGAYNTPAVYAGGPCEILMDRTADVTVDVSVQVKATSGTVTLKNRWLMVEAIGF